MSLPAPTPPCRASMMQQSNPPASVPDLHERACRDGLPTYTDPATGYAVFTAAYLRDRGACCDSGCRHCPYRDAAGPDAVSDAS